MVNSSANGCNDAMDDEARGRRKIPLCAFCREPPSSSEEEIIKQSKKLMEAGNAYAFYNLAGYYARGNMGMPQDSAKANELYLKAGQLGCHQAYVNLGNSYYYGRGVEVDKQKAKHFYELAAMNGNAKARYYVAGMEGQAGNIARGIKHFILSARAGDKESLDKVKEGFMLHGVVTRDEYANTLRAYQKIHDEIKSDTRDKASRNQSTSWQRGYR